MKIVLHDNRETHWEGAIAGKDLLTAIRYVKIAMPDLQVKDVAAGAAIELTWNGWKIGLVDENGQPVLNGDTIYPTLIFVATKAGAGRKSVDALVELFEGSVKRHPRRVYIQRHPLKSAILRITRWHTRESPDQEWVPDTDD